MSTPISFKSKRRTVVEETLLQKVLFRYIHLAAIFSAVWLLGFFNFSVTWIWIFLVLFVWRERHTRAKEHKIAISQEIARDEKGVILARVEDLPSWVNFPDVQRAEWVNRIIRQMWPYVGEYVEKMLREKVEPSVRNSLPAALQSFTFSNIDLGDIPPRIDGIKVFSKLKRDEIYMDVELNHSSDCYIAVSIKGINAGIKDLRLQGVLRVVFKPLINKPPMVGGLRLFFLNNPDVEFNLTSLASAFDIPGLSEMLHSIIQEQIAAMMVLPNCIPVKLVDELDINKLRYPQPQGVIRVKIVGAKELMPADFSLTGRGSSDPYVVVKLGSKEFRTSVIPKSLEPVWNETFEMIVDSADGQLLYLDLFDDDQGSKDDPLGRAEMDLSQVEKNGFADEWLPLEEVKQGMVHIQLTWLWLANDPLELERVVQELRQDKTLEEEKAHVAMLLVFLDSASNLPTQSAKKTVREPSPQVTLTVGQQSVESKVKTNTNEPRWEESFRFMLHNVNQQDLDVEIMDTKAKKLIGRTEIKLRELLTAEDMVMDQKFDIRTSDPDSGVHMRLALRILTPRANPRWTEEEEDLLSANEEKEKTDKTTEDETSAVTPASTTAAVTDAVTDASNAAATAATIAAIDAVADAAGASVSEKDKASVVRQDTVDKTDVKPALDTTGQAQTVETEAKTPAPENPETTVTNSNTDAQAAEEKSAVSEVKVVAVESKQQTSASPPEKTQPESAPESSGEVQMEVEDRQEQPTLTVPNDTDPEADADALSKAFKTFGADEAAIINILGKRTQQQRQTIALNYNMKYQKDLSKVFSSKLSGDFKTLCMELILDQDEFDAKQLYKAMKGLGTNEQVLVEIICTRSNARLNKIKDAYKRLYNKELEAAVADDTSGDFQRLLLGCLQATRAEGAEFDRAKARRDAQALVLAGEKTWGTDESIFQTILVSGSYAQLRATFEEYHKLTNKDIEESIQSEMSGDLKNGMLTIVQMIRRKENYFAKALYKCMKGIGTDDDTLIRIVASRSEVDMVQIKEEFSKEYNTTLGSFIVGDTKGDYRKLLLLLIDDEEAKK